LRSPYIEIKHPWLESTQIFVERMLGEVTPLETIDSIGRNMSKQITHNKRVRILGNPNNNHKRSTHVFPLNSVTSKGLNRWGGPYLSSLKWATKAWLAFQNQQQRQHAGELSEPPNKSLNFEKKE